MTERPGGEAGQDEGGPPTNLPSVSPAGSPVLKRLIVWNEAGMPVPSAVPAITAPQLDELALTALSLPYEDPLGLEPEFEGMSNAEVMSIRRARKAAAGDDHATDAVLDRILGKAMIKTENKTVKIGYEDYLKEVEKRQVDTPAPPIDVSASPSSLPAIEDIDPFKDAGGIFDL